MAQSFKKVTYEKPREKLARLGVEGLKEEELVALILRTGYSGKNVMALASEISRKYPGRKILEMPYSELSALKGMGNSRAAAILAGFELAKRALVQSKRVQITNPQDALSQVDEIRYRRKENFVALYINARNELICKEFISIGTLDASIAHPREVFSPAILCSAFGVILSHNHPSGSATPSDYDRKMTRQLVEAGKILGIEVLDHIIVTPEDFYSFRENGDILGPGN
ncbi:MAG: DNA repair protein RadC [Elusimicrobiota bacterium]